MKKDHPLTADLTRIVTPREMDAQRAGSTRIAPGIWLDADGDVHFSIPELLAMVDLEDTPANREEVAQMVAEIMSRHGLPIIRQDPES